MNYNALQLMLKDKKEVFSLGQTVCGREIYCITQGTGVPVLIHGAIHAREHLTTDVVMYLASIDMPKGIKFYFVPMVNPDGVEIVHFGAQSAKAEYRERIERVAPDTKLFKANARCVDLNVNFDADWGLGDSNVFEPSSASFVGVTPFSEIESRALRDLTYRIKPKVTLSYHLMGEEIYWSYKRIKRYKAAAKEYSRATGYPLKTARGSVGGYKDWYLTHFDGIGLTIEVGQDLYHPYPASELAQIIDCNKDILNVTHKVMTENKWI